LLGHDAIPVFVTGEAEDRVRARIDRGIDVDRAIGPEERGERAGVVEFERVVLEDDSPPVAAIGWANSMPIKFTSSGSALPGPTSI
jgi:hypothetical protein